MSTISLPYEKQIRHFYVADAIASETTQAAFIATASIGEMQIFDQAGNAVDYTSGELVGKDLFLLKKNQKGGISRTDLITPKDVTYLKGIAPRDKVGKSQVFTLGVNPTTGAEYLMSGKVNYGNSEENFVTFWSGVKAKSGETANAMLRRFASQISVDLASSIHTAAKANTADNVIVGTAASGSVTISGTAGSVDSVSVDGVVITSKSVPFNATLTQTATDVAANINAYQKKYVATSSAGVVTIKPVQKGSQLNGLVVSSTSTTLTTTDANLSGGTTTLSGPANAYFTIDVTGNVLTITERDWILDNYRVGLRTHDQLMFNFEITSKTDEDNVVKTETAPVYARGKGYQMMELERYLVGHRAEFETLDTTLSFGRKYDTVASSDYFVLELKYFDISRDSAKHSDKMLTIISTDAKTIDAIGFAIEAAMGKAEGTTWKELDVAADGADNV